MYENTVVETFLNRIPHKNNQELESFKNLTLESIKENESKVSNEENLQKATLPNIVSPRINKMNLGGLLTEG